VASAEPGGVRRIAVLDDAALGEVDAELAQRYRRCVALLEESGAIETCAAPKLEWTATARAAFWEVAHDFAKCSTGASPAYRALPGYRPLHDIGGALGRVLAQAASRPPTKLADGRVLIQQCASRLKYCLQQAHALLTPTCPESAPSVTQDPVNHIAAFTAPANAAGLPAVAWNQRLATGGTLSLQLIGRYGDDLPLVDLATRVERQLEAPARRD
jgi:Asp-tRNA(Asn)/Glu-tRNA(Gln) amidotransferase A subunit family amidase